MFPGASGAPSAVLAPRSAPHPWTHVQAIASPAFINLGNTTSFSALVSGGRPWFAYAWTGMPTGCAAGNVSAFSCVPTDLGTFSVTVTVTDSAGRTTANSTTLVVNTSASPVPSTPPEVTLLASPSYLTLGNATDLVAMVSGGRPWFSYSWSPLPPGCTTGNSSILVCRPTSVGTFSATVTIADSLGRSDSNSTEIVVNRTATSNGGGSSGGVLNLGASFYVFVGLIGVVAAVATAAVIVVALRRRRPPPPPRPPPPIPSGQRLYIPPTLDEPGGPGAYGPE